jgi:hypothetical protein
MAAVRVKRAALVRDKPVLGMIAKQ